MALQYDIKRFEREYSDASFWEKIKRFARVAGREVVEKALTLYYVAKDRDTPMKVKATIFAALGYFILPLDAVPDMVMGGYSDDLGVLAITMAMLVDAIKREHRDQARSRMRQWAI
ncbi:MAG: DUF1232 domain-containing protein [Epsilonproteobacteria bacterium]|nr:hypothetical protein [Campylobacterota bacterium]NPA56942.1 DUF1232 domain-containing protein [Campylobacterota bacterium]